MNKSTLFFNQRSSLVRILILSVLLACYHFISHGLQHGLVSIVMIALIFGIAAELMKKGRERRVNTDLLQEVNDLNGSSLKAPSVSFWSSFPVKFFTILITQGAVLVLVGTLFPSYVTHDAWSWRWIVYPIITSAIIVFNTRN